MIKLSWLTISVFQFNLYQGVNLCSCLNQLDFSTPSFSFCPAFCTNRVLKWVIWWVSTYLCTRESVARRFFAAKPTFWHIYKRQANRQHLFYSAEAHAQKTDFGSREIFTLIDERGKIQPKQILNCCISQDTYLNRAAECILCKIYQRKAKRKTLWRFRKATCKKNNGTCLNGGIVANPSPY